MCAHTEGVHMYVVNMEMKIYNKQQIPGYKFILIKILNVHKCSVPPVVGCLLL